MHTYKYTISKDDDTKIVSSEKKTGKQQYLEVNYKFFLLLLLFNRSLLLLLFFHLFVLFISGGKIILLPGSLFQSTNKSKAFKSWAMNYAFEQKWIHIEKEELGIDTQFRIAIILYLAWAVRHIGMESDRYGNCLLELNCLILLMDDTKLLQNCKLMAVIQTANIVWSQVEVKFFFALILLADWSNKGLVKILGLKTFW